MAENGTVRWSVLRAPVLVRVQGAIEYCHHEGKVPGQEQVEEHIEQSDFGWKLLEKVTNRNISISDFPKNK